MVNELYADVFTKTYGLATIGLRYFNVFGSRQDPKGAYAAVIPKWLVAMIKGKTVFINGDGETSRDFCYIENAVQANLLAATTDCEAALNQVYNIAVGERTSLNELFMLMKEVLIEANLLNEIANPIYRDFRSGDVVHSMADIDKATSLLGYLPTHDVKTGLDETMIRFLKHIGEK